MGTIKLESLVNDKRSSGSEINFTIKEGTRTHRLTQVDAVRRWGFVLAPKPES